MTNSLEDEIQRIVANMDNEHHSQKQEQPGTTEQEIEPAETIHIHYFPDAIVIVKEGEDKQQEDNAVETTLAQTKKPPVFIAYAVCVSYLFLILSCIGFQLYLILNPPIATVTIIPKAQTVTLTGTLQLGRVLQPLTISQSQTTPTTGKGHQDAKQTQGAITFYNGQLQSVSVPAGTVLAGSDGVEIVTDQDAYLPAESQTIPPTLGKTTVSAHALVPGTRGNIPTGDINQGCCAPSVLAQNTASFHGGQNERDFSTVSTQDINKLSTPLKTALAQSMQGALNGQLQPNEQVYTLPCNPTVTSDHQPGEEARFVKVAVSQTCSAVAYNREEVVAKATGLLATQAQRTIGAGYSLFGTTHVLVKQATVTNTPHPLVFLSFKATGTWIYALSQQSQEQIKHLIAGKPTQEAERLLSSLRGIEHASLHFSGIGDDTSIPKNTQFIHLVLLVL